MKLCVCVLGPIPSLLVLRSPRGDQGLLQRYMIFLFNTFLLAPSLRFLCLQRLLITLSSPPSVCFLSLGASCLFCLFVPPLACPCLGRLWRVVNELP